MDCHKQDYAAYLRVPFPGVHGVCLGQGSCRLRSWYWTLYVVVVSLEHDGALRGLVSPGKMNSSRQSRRADPWLV